MADQVITKQELIDAQKDAQTLEDAVNGEPGKLIKSRTGREFYSLASVPQINTMTREEVAAAVTPKANKVDVDTALSNLSTTANKYYSTLAAANADIANIALNQSVTIGEEANSGLWEKKITGATSLTKSPYDPLMQAKNLVDALKSASDLEDSKLNTGITNLRNDFDSIAQKTANLYNNQNLINHPNAGFFLSDFIAVESGQRYKKTRTDGVKDDVHHVQAFDANKQPVVVENGFSYWQNAAWHTTGIVIPENVAFVRVAVSVETKDILMFTRFDVDTSSYIPHRIVEIHKESLLAEVATTEKLAHIGEVLLDQKLNLFNPLTISKGYWPNNYINFTPSESYWTSDFIAVDAGKEYVRLGSGFTSGFFVYAFDSHYFPMLVNGSKSYWDAGILGPIPDGVAYVKLIFGANQQHEFGFIEKDRTGVSGAVFNEKIRFAGTDRVLTSKEIVNEIDKLANINAITQKTANLYNNQNLINHPTPEFFLSDFIAVESGQRYKKTRTDGVKDDVHHVQAFDANKQPVVVENGFSYWQNAAWHTTGIVIPENVTFVRVVVNSSTKDILMFTRFDVDTSSYIPYVRLGDDLLKLLKNETGNEAVSVTHHHNVDLIGSIEYQLFDTDYAHLISYGQSLSTGNEADRAITTTAVARTYMIGDRVWIDNGNNGANVLNPLVASLYGQNGEAPIVSASQVFRKLLDKHHPHNSVDLIGTSCGYSGRSIEELSKESTNGTNHYTQNFITALNRAKSIADANSKTISCPALIWMQGEYNYTSRTGRGLTIGSDATNNKETYKSLLMILKNNMQADVMSIYGQTKNPLFFMYQVAGGYINLDNMPINMAMIEFEAENDDVIFMNPTYPVPDYGGGHLSANGYRWYGEYIAKQLSASLFQHKSSVVTQMRDVKVFGKKILIECQVPNPPLVIDTFTTQAVASNGFKVWDESGTLTILSVKIINGIAIELTLNRELGTNPAISYAGKDRSGSGNVRDSDRYASGLIYESDDGFRAPTYMPKDAKNVILDGKKLPMQNWLVAFYKELTQAS